LVAVIACVPNHHAGTGQPARSPRNCSSRSRACSICFPASTGQPLGVGQPLGRVAEVLLSLTHLRISPSDVDPHDGTLALALVNGPEATDDEIEADGARERRTSE
jgi:hypothetical protein